jgi:hypothetical protein
MKNRIRTVFHLDGVVDSLLDKRLTELTHDRDVAIHRLDHERDMARQEIENADRSARDRHDADLDAEMDRRARRYVEEAADDASDAPAWPTTTRTPTT